MTPIEKLYALLESNGIYDEAISLLKEHKDYTSQYAGDRESETYAIGPDGMKITAADLPPVAPKRWSPLLMAKLVILVKAGLFSFDEAYNRYGMSAEELSLLIRKYDKYYAERGVDAFSSMKSQKYKA